MVQAITEGTVQEEVAAVQLRRGSVVWHSGGQEVAQAAWQGLLNGPAAAPARYNLAATESDPHAALGLLAHLDFTTLPPKLRTLALLVCPQLKNRPRDDV